MTESFDLDYDAFQAAAPEVAKALLEMGRAVDRSGFDKALSELVKLRVSQINECVFCTHLHLHIARRAGVPQDKLDLLPVWREAGSVFSEAERVALDWAEVVTRMGGSVAAPDQDQFDAEEWLHLTITIATINAWNRIAGALHFPRHDWG